MRQNPPNRGATLETLDDCFPTNTIGGNAQFLSSREGSNAAATGQ